MAGKKLVLNVGGNSRDIDIPEHFREWEQLLLDIAPGEDVDLVCDARLIATTLPAGSYDAVYCSHNLEHYFRHDVDKVLKGFLHALTDGGFAEIRVPDIGGLIQLLAENKLDIESPIYKSKAGPITAHDMIYGYGLEIERSGQDWYAHKTGFTVASLLRALHGNGFAEVYFVPPLSVYELHVFAFKGKAGAEARAAYALGEPVSP